LTDFLDEQDIDVLNVDYSKGVKSTFYAFRKRMKMGTLVIK
jgi:hypothetical protein